MKFSKKRIEQLKLAPADKPYYKIFRDDQLKGFALRVTSDNTKTFILDKKIKGKLVRHTIGRFGELTVEQARTVCQTLIGQHLSGNAPERDNTHKQAELPTVITLEQVLQDYLQARKGLKASTINEYQSVVKRNLGEWLQQPLNAISKETATKLHSKIGARSHAAANKTLKVLSALFNFAIVNYEDSHGNTIITDNPVIRLSQTRAWYPKRLRRSKIEISDLPKWFHTVNKLHDVSAQSIANSVKHHLILLLFTGLRREEAMPLIWAEYRDKDKTKAKQQRVMDLKNRVIIIPDPKNHEEHCLPMSDYLVELFTQHKTKTGSQYVFPNATGKNHIKEPRKIMLQVMAQSGIQFTLHDLRRTFISIAESLDIPAYALKRLLNHKINHSDVTAGYIVTDVERLRKPIQMISDYITKLSGVLT